MLETDKLTEIHVKKTVNSVLWLKGKVKNNSKNGYFLYARMIFSLLHTYKVTNTNYTRHYMRPVHAADNIETKLCIGRITKQQNSDF